jgi:hypothetical protein
MPTASVRDIAMHYETEGSGDPLILIPYLSADHALLRLSDARVLQALHVCGGGP